MMVKRKKRDKKKRPIAVAVIAAAMVVLFLVRLFQFFEPLLRNGVFRNGINAPLFTGWKITPFGNILLSSAIYLVLSLTGIVVLIGFLRLRHWSWVLLMVWTCTSLTISLVDYFYRHTNYAV